MIFRVHYEIHDKHGALHSKGSSDQNCDTPAEAAAVVRQRPVPEDCVLRVLKTKRVKE